MKENQHEEDNGPGAPTVSYGSRVEVDVLPIKDLIKIMVEIRFNRSIWFRRTKSIWADTSPRRLRRGPQ